MRLADAGLAVMAKAVDTLIVIPNPNLFRRATERTSLADSFKMADEVCVLTASQPCDVPSRSRTRRGARAPPSHRSSTTASAR